MSPKASNLWFLLIFLSTTIEARARAPPPQTPPLPSSSIPRASGHNNSRANFYTAGQYKLDDCPTTICRCESWPYSNRTDLHCPRDISSVPALSQDNRMQFDWAFLSEARIKKLEANAFITFHVTRINLSRNKFGSKGSISTGSFKTARGNRLKELVLTQTGLSEVPCKALDLRWLETLALGSNAIRELRRDCFRDLRQLTTLKLNQNQIATIRNGAFKDLGKLQTLDLSNNYLTILKRGQLKGLRSLTQLTLSENQMSTIEPSSFKVVKGLQVLNLQSNAFSKLEVGTLRGLKKLKELNIKENKITTIEDGTFMTVRRLRSLTLDVTYVKSLGNMTLAGLKGLTHLVLGEVGRERLPVGLLAHSHKLKHIDLTNYNSGFKGLSLETLSAKLNLRKLEVQVTPLYECSCDVTWIKSLTKRNAQVKGQCYNIMPLTCENHTFI